MLNSAANGRRQGETICRALTTPLKKLGVLGAIIVASAVVNMCVELYLHYSHYTDALHSIATEIEDDMRYVFPNSLSILLWSVLRGQVGAMHLLAFYMLIDIPLAYACGLGVEKLRRRYGFLRIVAAYAVISLALYIFSVFLAFKI